MSSLAALLLGALTLLAPQQSERVSTTDVWRDHPLPNGAVLSVLSAPQLESQAFFLVLPTGYVLDGPGETQWAHVLEHLLLRVVDPEHDLHTSQGLRVAAETTQSALRLEVYAPPERWQAGLELLTEWLATASVSRKDLAAEQSRITEELRELLPQRRTHKWAAAAWAQVVRHGAEHVRIQGALGELDVDTVAQELLPRAQLGPGVRLVSVGPAPVGEVVEAVQNGVGLMGDGQLRLPERAEDPQAARAVAHREATWDISARHYIEAYLLPDESAAERVAADALALLVTQRVAQTPSFEQRGFLISAAVDHLTPEGRWFVLSSSLPAGESVETLRSAFRQLLTSVQGAAETPLALAEMRRELSTWPDFAALRREYAGNPVLYDLEARQVLFLLYAQLNMGLSLEQLLATYATLDREAVDALARRLFREPNRSSLLLVPRD